MDKYESMAYEIHSTATQILNEERITIYNRLLSLGADGDELLRLSAIDIELAFRGFKKDFMGDPI